MSYRSLNPLKNTSIYSNWDEDTKVKLFGNVTVVPEAVKAVQEKYSTIGLTKGNDAISTNEAVTACDAVSSLAVDPVIVKLPVITAEPEKGKPLPP